MAYTTVNGKAVKVRKGETVLGLKARFDFTIAEQLRRAEIAANKGKHYKGACGVKLCNRSEAIWWNKNTSTYYCHRCAIKVNNACERFGEEPACAVGIHEEATPSPTVT